MNRTITDEQAVQRAVRGTAARSLAALIACALCVAAGCAPTAEAPDSPQPDLGAGETTARPPAEPAAATTPPSSVSPPGPEGVSRTHSVRAAVLPLGKVPADGFSLPLLSPDGRYVATQTGVAPEWSTALAEIDAPVPEATTVEIHEALFEQRQVVRRSSLGDAILLGRQSDAEGFLVEHPRADGSRWIGRAAWTSGQVEWLVQDDAANAFATTGPAGQLAWSRRPVGAQRLELVVRDAGGSTWTLGGPGQDWLMPTWSGKDDGLFALLLEDGRLDLVHVVASGPSAARQSLRRERLMSGGSNYIAYQLMIGQPVMHAAPPAREELVFYHPIQHRAAVWRPHAVDRAMILLGRGSITAVLDSAGYALTPTDSDLELIDFERRGEPAPLLKGVLIPRATPAAPYPYVLLTPIEREVGLTAMELLR